MVGRIGTDMPGRLEPEATVWNVPAVFPIGIHLRSSADVLLPRVITDEAQ